MLFSYSVMLRSFTHRFKVAGWLNEFGNEILDFVKGCKYLSGSATSRSSTWRLQQEDRPSDSKCFPFMLPQCLIVTSCRQMGEWIYSSTYSWSPNYMYVNSVTCQALWSWREGPTVLDAMFASESVWRLWKKKIYLSPSENGPTIPQLSSPYPSR